MKSKPIRYRLTEFIAKAGTVPVPVLVPIRKPPSESSRNLVHPPACIVHGILSSVEMSSALGAIKMGQPDDEWNEAKGSSLMESTCSNIRVLPCGINTPSTSVGMAEYFMAQLGIEQVIADCEHGRQNRRKQIVRSLLFDDLQARILRQVHCLATHVWRQPRHDG